MNYNNILKNYNKKGFAKIGNIINENKLGMLTQEIFDAENTISYFDNENFNINAANLVKQSLEK